MERAYQRAADAAGVVRVRRAAWLALLLFGAFVLVDLATLAPAVYRWTVPIRVLALMLPCALVLLATLHPVRQRRLQTPVTLASACAGLGTVAVIGVGLRLREPLPYEGILLVTLFIYLVAGLRWHRAVAANVLVLLAFVAVELAWQQDAEARLYQVMFMIAANLVGAYGGHSLEHSARSAFLAQRRLHEQAERDGLTGLYNRRALDEHLARLWRQSLREGGSIAVAMVDVDHFKAYNDRYGHAEGDAALRAVAAVVDAQARRPLDMAARYGGEEFIVVWYRPTDVAALGEQLRAAVDALDRPHAASGVGRLTVSVGLAEMRATATTRLATLVQAADHALYAAKQAGRNRVCHDGVAGPRPQSAPHPHA